MKTRLGILCLCCAAVCHTWAEGYRVTLGTAPDSFPVVVVTGTPKEMGLALGTLMKPEIQTFAPRFLEMAQQEKEGELSLDNLDKAWKSMEPFMGSQFVEEMQGLAQGSGLPLELLKRVHMIPAISEYSCSGVAIWGKATRNGHLYQIRNLDYTTRGILLTPPTTSCSGKGWRRTIRRRSWNWKGGLPQMNNAVLIWWHSVGQRDLSVEAVARTKAGPRNEVGSSARPAGIQQP